MSYAVVIPARLHSSRLPRKMLADIAGKPLIAHAVDRANESNANRVVVATDHQSIADVLVNSDCEVCMTRDDHVSGSERLSEVINTLDFGSEEIIVGVQGDEPLVPGKLIDLVASSLELAEDAVVSTAAKPIDNIDDYQNPNVVKVVFDRNGKAMYFSRAAIPYAVEPQSEKQKKKELQLTRQRSANQSGKKKPHTMGSNRAWHHIGIYAYRADYLRNYHTLVPSVLEQSERLEQLRVLDNGDTIMVETVDYEVGLGVDTQADLDFVRTEFAKR